MAKTYKLPNLKKYAGQWVGIWQGKVVASSFNSSEVYRKANKIAKVPKDIDLTDPKLEEKIPLVIPVPRPDEYMHLL